MLRNLLTSIFLILLFQPSYGQYDYKFIVDKDLSSNVGAANFVTLQKFIFTGEDLLLHPKLFSEDDFLSKTGGIAYRLAKTILLDAPVDILIGLTNHEYFGHGWKLREYNQTDIHYDISLPPPYGKGSGQTSLGNGPYYTNDEDVAMRIAGAQANSTISDELRNVFLETGKIHFRQAFAYLGGVADLTHYILATSRTGYLSNDISYYTIAVQRRNPAINLRMLKSNVLINFANPFLIYSLYSFFDRYLLYGEAEISYPMINVFNLDYLPSFRFGLTPFGAEIRMENLVKASLRIYNVYLGYDGFGEFTSSRFGIQVEHLFKNDLIDIGGKLEVWHQPFISLSSHLQTGGEETDFGPVEPVQTFGGMVTVNAKMHPFSQKWGFYFEGGYKTSGFTETEQLSSGLILRGGGVIQM